VDDNTHSVAFPHVISVAAAWVVCLSHAPLHRQGVALAFQSKICVVGWGSGTVIVTGAGGQEHLVTVRVRIRVRVWARARVRARARAIGLGLGL